MKTVVKWIVRSLLAGGLLIVLALVGAFGYRAYRQSENARFLAIETPNAVVEAGYVEIGGVSQWIQIRGENRDNPVLILVAGGPNWSSINQVYRELRSWERYFTIVQWDQRGAGRTRLLEHGYPGQPISRYVDDGIAVAEYAHARLGDKKFILIGWSWGSLLGTEMARARPDLFSAYFGTGQIVNMRANEAVGYQRLLERMRASRDQSAVTQLEQIGHPPYRDMQGFETERLVLMTHPIASEPNLLAHLLLAASFAPGYGASETFRIATAQLDIDPKLLDELLAYDALSRGTSFSIPMFFFIGTDDIQTPAELVGPYVDQLTAPRKEIVSFPGAGHWTPMFESDDFLAELRARISKLP